MFTEKHRVATIMFNYFDKNYSGHIEREELWEEQMTEDMAQLSSLCSLVDLVTFNELGKHDGKLTADEFIQAFGMYWLPIIFLFLHKMSEKSLTIFITIKANIY